MLKQAVLDGSVWFIFGLVWLVLFSSPLQVSWEETQLGDQIIKCFGTKLRFPAQPYQGLAPG